MRQYLAVPFDSKRLRIERFNAEWSYHATYTFHGVKGALAERWAHGPTFGAVGDAGSSQINLTPPPDEDDHDRLVAVAGLRASAVIGEGKRRAAEALKLWPRWFDDVDEALHPLRYVSVGANLIGLYPIKDPWKVTQQIKLRYYQQDAIEELAAVPTFHVAPEIFEADEKTRRTVIVGVLGPPHKGHYFSFPSPPRDERWWLAARVVYAVVDDAGIEKPIGPLRVAVDTITADWERIGSSVFPKLVG